MNEVELFQIRTARFYYEDMPGKSKRRPVVVLEIRDDEALVLMAKVTSREPRPDCPGEVRLIDWESEGLDRPSTVRCSKVAIVSVADLEEEPLVGKLSSVDAVRVAAGYLEANR